MVDEGLQVPGPSVPENQPKPAQHPPVRWRRLRRHLRRAGWRFLALLSSAIVSILAFIAGQVTQPSLGSIGERIAAWADGRPWGPHLTVEFLRQDPDGAIWLDVENTGTRTSRIIRMELCATEKWLLWDPVLVKPGGGDQHIVYRNPHWREPGEDFIWNPTPNLIEWKSDESLFLSCSVEAIYQPDDNQRVISRGETKSIRFESNDALSTVVSFDSFQKSMGMGGNGNCPITVRANNYWTVLAPTCRLNAEATVEQLAPTASDTSAPAIQSTPDPKHAE